MRTIKKLLRLTPLNEAIKAMEVKKYKSRFDFETVVDDYFNGYLDGLKMAHTLVKTIKK